MDSTPFPPSQPPYRPPTPPAYPPSAQAPSAQPPYQPPAPVYGPPTYGQPTYGHATYGSAPMPTYGYPGQPVPPGGSAGRPPRRRLPWWSWTLGGIGGLLIVCCVLGTVVTLARGHGLAGSPSASSVPSVDGAATDTPSLAPQPTATSASVVVVSQPTDTPVPAPQPSATTAPAPQPTNTPVPATIRAGWYQVTLQGQAGPNVFSLPAALAVFKGVYAHPVDICLGTGTIVSPVTSQAPGVIYFQSNSTCIGLFGGANGAGATAGYDDGFVTANIAAGTVEVDPDPTHCCNYNLSPNEFDISAYAYSADPIARGTVKLQFSPDGSVTGSIALASCQINPYCSDAEAVFYNATLSGSFAHT